MPRIPALVAAAEIGDILGVGRQRVSQLAARPDFPEPVAVLAVGRVWLESDVLAWARQTGRLPQD